MGEVGFGSWGRAAREGGDVVGSFAAFGLLAATVITKIFFEVAFVQPSDPPDHRKSRRLNDVESRY
jgi:hypothetical protein